MHQAKESAEVAHQKIEPVNVPPRSHRARIIRGKFVQQLGFYSAFHGEIVLVLVVVIVLGLDSYSLSRRGTGHEDGWGKRMTIPSVCWSDFQQRAVTTESGAEG
jgi:hypothetical protein